MHTNTDPIAELFADISNAPTGGVDENFVIRPLKDQLSDSFIRILAGHLYANGWRKSDELNKCTE